MVDYLAAAAAFRAKAASTTFPEEAKILLAKAEELEAKYGNRNSRPTNDTTTTSRDGRGEWNPFATRNATRNATREEWAQWEPPPTGPIDPKVAEYWARYMQDLLRNQWQWNRKYYDQDGNPEPGYGGDTDNLYEETYKYAEDEDYDPTGEWYT